MNRKDSINKLTKTEIISLIENNNTLNSILKELFGENINPSGQIRTVLKNKIGKEEINLTEYIHFGKTNPIWNLDKLRLLSLLDRTATIKDFLSIMGMNDTPFARKTFHERLIADNINWKNIKEERKIALSNYIEEEYNRDLELKETIKNRGEKCEKCKITEWSGFRVQLTLSKKSNLLLCANCYSQENN